jgi:N-acetylmuramoyl-L-alanine amidase
VRDIRQIIIHCSATPEGRDVKASQIKKWHIDRGWSDIGYHYVIELDGTIRKGRKESVIGAHCKGMNRDSIGVCYIGGVDVNMKPKDTRTQEQLITLISLLVELRYRYPNATIHGHNEFSSKACPSFNVEEFVKFIQLKS